MCYFHLPTNAFVPIRCLCQLQCLYLNHLNFLPLNFSSACATSPIYQYIHSCLVHPYTSTNPPLYPHFFHSKLMNSLFLYCPIHIAIHYCQSSHNPVELKRLFKYFTIIYDSYPSCPLLSYFTLVDNILLMPQPLVHLKYVTYGSSTSFGLTIL